MIFVIDDITLDCSKTLVMGILNTSPDSFFDGGQYCSVDKAIDRTAVMIAEGATFVDVGGESTRPGACAISEDEELIRVVPVIEQLVKRFQVFISVNTSKALVIRESAYAGAHLINDVRSLNEHGALEAAVSCHLPVCLMYTRDDNMHTMQSDLVNKNIFEDLNAYFVMQIARCEKAGINRNKLIIDPGFGFGKNLIHNYTLLSNLKYLHHFNLPILVGISRKSMIKKITGVDSKQDIIGSITCAVIAAIQGIQIIRVHDVKETIEALKIVSVTHKHKGLFVS